MRCLAPTALVLACGCVPIDNVDVPAGVDYWAWVSAAPDTETTFRLTKSTRPTSSINGWLVGYSAAQLVDAGLTPSQQAVAAVRLAAPCLVPLAPPLFVYPEPDFDDTVPVLALDQWRKGCDRSVYGNERLSEASFEAVPYEIADSISLSIVALGDSGAPRPLFALSDRSVYEVTDTGVRLVGETDRQVRGLTYLGNDYLLEIADGRAGWRLWAGRNLEQLEFIGDGARSGGRFHTTDAGVILSVSLITGQADVLLPQSSLVVAAQANLGIPEKAQVLNDPLGGVVFASSRGHSWRTDGLTVERELGIRPPFARIGRVLAYGDELGVIRVPNPSSPGETSVLANVTEVRQSQYDAPIQAMVSYEDGAMVGDSLGYISFVRETGEIEIITHLIQNPLAMYVMGRDLVVIAKDVNSQIFYTGQRTNFTVYVLRRLTP